MKERLLKVFDMVFDAPKNPEEMVKNDGDWDSLSNINLIVGLEKEFNIKLMSIEDMRRIVSFDCILELLEEKCSKTIS